MQQRQSIEDCIVVARARISDLSYPARNKELGVIDEYKKFVTELLDNRRWEYRSQNNKDFIMELVREFAHRAGGEINEGEIATKLREKLISAIPRVNASTLENDRAKLNYLCSQHIQDIRSYIQQMDLTIFAGQIAAEVTANLGAQPLKQNIELAYKEFRKGEKEDRGPNAVKQLARRALSRASGEIEAVKSLVKELQGMNKIVDIDKRIAEFAKKHPTSRFIGLYEKIKIQTPQEMAPRSTSPDPSDSEPESPRSPRSPRTPR